MKAEATCPQLREFLIGSLIGWKLGSNNTNYTPITYTGLKVGLVQKSRMG